MAGVIIGVEPHKRSAAIEVINERELVLSQSRLRTDADRHKAMLATGRKHTVARSSAGSNASWLGETRRLAVAELAGAVRP